MGLDWAVIWAAVAGIGAIAAVLGSVWKWRSDDWKDIHVTRSEFRVRQSALESDATIIAAPSSTKIKDGQLDPEMHQSKKRKQRANLLTRAHLCVSSKGCAGRAWRASAALTSAGLLAARVPARIHV